MAVEHVTSDFLNEISTPGFEKKDVSAFSGRQRILTDTFSVSAVASAGSIYTFAQLPRDARVFLVNLYYEDVLINLRGGIVGEAGNLGSNYADRALGTNVTNGGTAVYSRALDSMPWVNRGLPLWKAYGYARAVDAPEMVTIGLALSRATTRASKVFTIVIYSVD